VWIKYGVRDACKETSIDVEAYKTFEFPLQYPLVPSSLLPHYWSSSAQPFLLARSVFFPSGPLKNTTITLTKQQHRNRTSLNHSNKCCPIARVKFWWYR
jgi:hypothetical protein